MYQLQYNTSTPSELVMNKMMNNLMTMLGISKIQYGGLPRIAEAAVEKTQHWEELHKTQENVDISEIEILDLTLGIAFTLPEHSELPCSGLTEDIQVKADLANRKIKQTSAFSDLWIYCRTKYENDLRTYTMLKSELAETCISKLIYSKILKSKL